MKGEATHVKSPYPPEQEFVAAAAIASGEVLQMPDGSAGVRAGLRAAESGDTCTVYTAGRFLVPKVAGIAILQGGEVFWDRANSKATFNRAVVGAFLLGVAAADAAEADTEVEVHLNARSFYRANLAEGLFDTAIVKTAGSPAVARHTTGTGYSFTLDATAEAQKVDALSQLSVRPADGPIFEARLAIFDIGNAVALDIDFGLASATHASDFEAIAEFAAFHLDGASLNLLTHSDDGTTDVAPDATGVAAVDDTYAEFWIDARDQANVKFYVNGVRVNADATFTLAAAAGPLKAIVHVEKTANATLANVAVDFLRVRSTDL